MRGKRIQVVYKHNYTESPPGDVGQWQGSSLDLLRQAYEDTQYQDRIEACGYRTLTWRILRALKSINDAKVVVGESAVTAAPFFESVGGPSKPFGGPHEGSKSVRYGWIGGRV